MTTVHLQGNRSRPLSLLIGGGAAIAGTAHVNTWVQTTEPIDLDFLESFSVSESTWEIFAASTHDRVLEAFLDVSHEHLVELRRSAVFGSLRAASGGVHVMIVVADSVIARLTDLLLAALLDDHIYYVYSIDLQTFPAHEESMNLPTFSQFKDGARCYFTDVQFCVRSESDPDSVTRVDLSRR